MLGSGVSFKVDQKLGLYDGASTLPQRPARIFARHSSTISATLGSRIQRHLDAGKPLYIGLDPRDPPRDSLGMRKFCGGGREIKCGGYIKKDRKWVRFLTMGAPLDIAVKFILTLGLMMVFVALFWATNRIIQNRRLDKDFNLLLVIGQVVWGVFFGASCIFGMELMWGKWRRSPTAALFFTVSWVFVSIILLVTSAVWIYFYLTVRASLIELCNEKTVRVTTTWDEDSLRRMAPKAQVDDCLSRVGPRVSWTLAWGILYAISSYSGLIVVIWGRDYRRRLLEIKRCEEARNRPNSGGSNKLGLLLGTSPLGGLPIPRTYVSRMNDIESS